MEVLSAIAHQSHRRGKGGGYRGLADFGLITQRKYKLVFWKVRSPNAQCPKNRLEVLGFGSHGLVVMVW
ncbi:MAG: hypothetical protein ACYTXY_01145 [Nostoc sp.]